MTTITRSVMNRFLAMMASVKDMAYKPDMPKMSDFQSFIPPLRRSRKPNNPKPNPSRRATKPLYGGMAHRVGDPIGQTVSWSQDQVRAVEVLIGSKVKTTSAGMTLYGNIIGKHGDSVKKIVTGILGDHPPTGEMGESKEHARFRDSLCIKYGLPYPVDFSCGR